METKRKKCRGVRKMRMMQMTKIVRGRGRKKRKEKGQKEGCKNESRRTKDNLKFSPTLYMPAISMSVCISCGVPFVRKKTSCIKW
jgi:hypothetical protein